MTGEIRTAPNGDVKMPSPAAPNGHYKRPDFLSERAKAIEIDGTVRFPGRHVGGEPHNLRSAGKPNPATFPFSSIRLNLKPPLIQTLTGAPPEGLNFPSSVDIVGEDLDMALQYGPTAGIPKLRAWLENLQSSVHGRQKGNWAITMGTGSQDMMSKTFQAVLDPGEPVLLETPLYAGVLPPLRLLKSETIEIDIDEQGLSVENLKRTLSAWPEDKPRPKVLYTCPTGCNPSGCSASEERKLAVLRVCKEYGVLILEDDPYYFLAQHPVASYFALETQVFPEGGHVVRFDSFSKLLSAGMRLGWATGPPDILHAIDVSTAGANLQTSSTTQAIAYALLDAWGLPGVHSHSHAVAEYYARRRETFESLAHKYLDGLASWVSPVAGMFLWLDLTPSGIEDTFDLVLSEMLANGVLCVPGNSFYPNGRKSHHMRLSFSLVDLDHDAEKGFERLARSIKDKRKQLRLE